MLHIFRDLLRFNREFAIGVAFLGVIVVYSLLSFVSPVDPDIQFMEFPDLPPSGEYWFGTNSRGQDLFWQLTFAFRNTLGFGIMVAAFSRVISITVGLVSGYVGGAVDRVLMVINDVFVTLPLLLFNFATSGRNDVTGAISMIYIVPGIVILVLTARHLSGRSGAVGGFGQI